MKRRNVLMLPLALAAPLFSNTPVFAQDNPPSRKPEGVLRWFAVPARDGLGAFEGVEDDRDHSEPGVTHIFVEGDTYRFNMDTKQVEHPGDRQRNEVKGMVTDGQIQVIELGSTWRFAYWMYIPETLRATTTFSHIMQLKMPGDGTGPLMTMSLQNIDGVEYISVRAWLSGVTIARTELPPLRNHWIYTEVTATIGDNTDGILGWRLIDRGNVVVDAEKGGVDLWLGDRIRPKWGIYRSIKDTVNVQDTYLLLKNMKAYQLS